jgi:hypothetical protein
MEFVEALKKELQQTQRVMAEATARYKVLQETLNRLSGSATSAKRPRAQTKSAKPARARTKSPRSSQRGGRSNMAHIHDILVDHRTSGVAARDVIARLKTRGVRTTDNAVYAALTKVKQRKLAKVRDGKYFPTESLLKAAQANARRQSAGAASS